jgi:hypothetical protein
MSKRCILILSFFLVHIYSFSQDKKKPLPLPSSPFDYKKNKNIYFISLYEQDTMQIGTIIQVEGLAKGETGGMGENWDVTALNLNDVKGAENNWNVYTSPKDYVYNKDSVIQNSQYINGTAFDVEGGYLTSYGGQGYGTFDWSELTRGGDTASYTTTSCAGHCAADNNSIKYAKNVFDKNGNVLYSVNYGYSMEIINDSSGEVHDSAITPSSQYDTIFYSYTEDGLLATQWTNTNHNKIKYPDCFLPDSTGNNTGTQSAFYQNYINDTTMEAYIKEKIGYLPKAILFEIYSQGVFCYTYNKYDHKYYTATYLILER